ncbi:MAG: DUF748 domain-containing protein [Gammaproteobacteria bacterium]|nr:DUF748 domain-containing protein [Gammaproteobacteria bacterium]
MLYQLEKTKATKSHIDDVDINIFTGRFSISGLQTQTDEHPLLKIGQLTIRSPWWKLFGKEIVISELTLNNSQIPFVKNKDEALYIGIFIPAGENDDIETKKETATEDNPPWVVTVERLRINESSLHLKTSDISSKIHINSLSLDGFSTVSTEKSHLVLNASISDTLITAGQNRLTVQSPKPITWDSKQSTQFSNGLPSSVFLKGELVLGQLSVLNAATNATYRHGSLSLHVSADLNPVTNPNEGPAASLSIKSELSIKKPRIAGLLSNKPQSDTFAVDASDLDMQFIQRIALSVDSDPLRSSGTGRFHLQNANMKLENNELNYSNDSLSFQWLIKIPDLGKAAWQDTLTLSGGIDLEQINILDLGQDIGLLHTPQLRIRKLELLGNNHLNIESIELTQARAIFALPEDTDNQSSSVFSELIRAENIQLHPFNRLQVERLIFSSLDSQLHLTEDHKLRLIEPVLSRVRSLKSKSSDIPEHASPPRSSFTWRIESAQLKNGNIAFRDDSLSPSFTSQLALEALTLTPLDSGLEGQQTHLFLKGKINAHASILAQGVFTAFSQKPSSDIALEIEALEVLPFSPYLNQHSGYQIRHGQLDSSIQVKIDNGALNSNVNLHLKKLKLQPSSKNLTKRLNAQLTMPLDLSLNTLRDKNNNIRLSIPIQGNTSDPHFDFSSAIKQASAKATRSASISILKHALQPYGTMITVAELAYKGGRKLTKIRLDPIGYEIGSLQIGPHQKNYLGKVAALMKDKPKLNITLCGIAFIDEQPAPWSETDALKLAKERAEHIKSQLINEYKINATRLFSCMPKLDKPSKNKRAGRVDLHL